MSHVLPTHRTEVVGIAEGNCPVSCSQDGHGKYSCGWELKSWLVDERALWKVTGQNDVTYHRRYIAYKRHFWCYAHGDICMLCGWSGNRWRVGGGCDSSPSTPWFHLSFFCEALVIRKFLPWQFPCALTELSSWRVGDVSGSASVGRSLFGHILGGSVRALLVCYSS